MSRSFSFTTYARLCVIFMVILVLCPAAFGQKQKPKAQPLTPHPPVPGPMMLSYVLSFPQPHTHLYEVTLTINNVATSQLDLSLPTWTPGSYLQREYARHVQDFSVSDDSGQLRWQKVDKATWRVEAAAANDKPKTIRAKYRVYANELFTQTSHLDATHAYFNGATLFMYVLSAKDQPHRLKIVAPDGWRVTSPLALAPEADGYFTAPSYDVLIDSPTEVGTHKLLEFAVRGKTHRVAIWGEFEFDENKLKDDLSKIVEEGAKLFGGLPYDQYVFLVHVQPGIGGGTEHLNANVSQTRPDAFKSLRSYKGFLGLESHEYFHCWNVKRIRPLALGPFDYQHENYTRALWVSEGITSYYGDLILRRAGLSSSDEYLAGLSGLLAGYEQQPGRFIQSAESASFDAWIKHYRPDENSPNTVMSYYTKGEILGFLFDVEIRSLTAGAKSLDDVMRMLLENHGLPKPGFTDAELKATFEKAAGTDLTTFWNRYVSGNDEIDFGAYFNKVGLRLEKGYQLGTQNAASKTAKPGTLGLRTRPQNDRAVVANVLVGLPAYEGGINTGDELIAIDGKRIDTLNVAERLNDLRAGQRVTVSVFRREKMMNFELIVATKPFDRYTVAEIKEASDVQKSLRKSWLGEK